MSAAVARVAGDEIVDLAKCVRDKTCRKQAERLRDAANAAAAAKTPTKEIKAKRGTTLWGLARQNHTTADMMQRLNPDVDPRRIQIKQPLRVPASANPAAAPKQPLSALESAVLDAERAQSAVDTQERLRAHGRGNLSHFSLLRKKATEARTNLQRAVNEEIGAKTGAEAWSAGRDLIAPHANNSTASELVTKAVAQALTARNVPVMPDAISEQHDAAVKAQKEAGGKPTPALQAETQKLQAEVQKFASAEKATDGEVAGRLDLLGVQGPQSPVFKKALEDAGNNLLVQPRAKTVTDAYGRGGAVEAGKTLAQAVNGLPQEMANRVATASKDTVEKIVADALKPDFKPAAYDDVLSNLKQAAKAAPVLEPYVAKLQRPSRPDLQEHDPTADISLLHPDVVAYGVATGPLVPQPWKGSLWVLSPSGNPLTFGGKDGNIIFAAKPIVVGKLNPITAFGHGLVGTYNSSNGKWEAGYGGALTFNAGGVPIFAWLNARESVPPDCTGVISANMGAAVAVDQVAAKGLAVTGAGLALVPTPVTEAAAGISEAAAAGLTVAGQFANEYVGAGYRVELRFDHGQLKGIYYHGKEIVDLKKFTTESVLGAEHSPE